MPLFQHAILVDDSKLANIVTSKMLEKSGIASEIVLFSGAQEALTFLKSQGPNAFSQKQLLLLDIYMPGMDGFGFLEAFGTLEEEVQKSWKIFMLSSSISPDDIQRAESHPLVEGFLMKPLTNSFFTQFPAIA